MISAHAAAADLDGLEGRSSSTVKTAIIDEQHLRRMTLGDRRLEREVLQIYVRQSAIMLGRMASGEPAALAVAAHTLNGSARGIGAWRVAQAAERLECASKGGDEETLSEALTELKAASLEASAAVAERLGDPPAR
jgi:HPt (histidine-containing phosphotransfer) domain-containing protein